MNGLAALVLFSTLAACSKLVEPGIPPGEATPLFDGYMSYRTLDDIQKQLPDRSSWEVLWDGKIPARGPCPRFDEFTFIVPANHLGYKGRLQLTFINQRLRKTLFTPERFSLYVEALPRTGIIFNAAGKASAPPATLIWQSEMGGPFVGWSDTRFDDQSEAWTSYCS